MEPVSCLVSNANVPNSECNSFIRLYSKLKENQSIQREPNFQYVKILSDGENDVTYEQIFDSYTDFYNALETLREQQPVGIINGTGYPLGSHQAIYVYLLIYYKDIEKAREKFMQDYEAEPDTHCNMFFKAHTLPYIEKIITGSFVKESNIDQDKVRRTCLYLIDKLSKGG